MVNELFVTEKVMVRELVPSSKNPRKIKQEEKRKLWERIQKFGLIFIPIRDADGTILGGKQRCELLVQYGLGDNATRVDLGLFRTMHLTNIHERESSLVAALITS